MQDVQTPKRRRLRWALIASLALNLIFVGLFAGAAYRFAGGPGSVGSDGGHAARSYATPYVRALPRDARRAVFSGMRQGGDAIPSRAARRAIYDQVLMALRSEPFDADAVAALVRQQGQFALDFQMAAEGAWLAQVSKMSASERTDYADRVAEMLRRGPGKHGKKDRD